MSIATDRMTFDHEERIKLLEEQVKQLKAQVLSLLALPSRPTLGLEKRNDKRA